MKKIKRVWYHRIAGYAFIVELEDGSFGLINFANDRTTYCGPHPQRLGAEELTPQEILLYDIK